MKSQMILVVLLLAAVAVQSVPRSDGLMTCCFQFFNITPKIIQNVVKYSRTHPACANKGIIVTTKLNRRLCVDPEHELISKLAKTINA